MEQSTPATGGHPTEESEPVTDTAPTQTPTDAPSTDSSESPESPQAMETTESPDLPEPVETTQGSSALGGVIDEIDRRGHTYDVLGERAVRVGLTGDVVMAAVPLLAEADGALAVLAENRDGASAVLMRDGQDMFVVRRDPGVWEHFRSMGGPSAIVGSWRSGERTRFRQRHGALWKAIPAARDLAEKLGVIDHLPAETPPAPPTPPPAPARSRAARSTTPRAPRSTPARERKAEAPAPPPPPVCPRCFVQLPASGICDCG